MSETARSALATPKHKMKGVFLFRSPLDAPSLKHVLATCGMNPVGRAEVLRECGRAIRLLFKIRRDVND